MDKINKKASTTIYAKLMLIFAVTEPLATIPQIYQVWSSKSLAGVSLTSWILYTITSTIWLIYGFKIKNKPIAASGALWVSTQLLVVIGILVRSQ